MAQGNLSEPHLPGDVSYFRLSLDLALQADAGLPGRA